MAQDILTYKDGVDIEINIDLAQKDINIVRTKAGNVRTILIKQYGIGLVRDELIVNVSETLVDSEGDQLPLPPQRLDPVIRDQEYFADVNAYSQNGALAFAKLFIDVILKQRLEQTRCYAADGTFVHPVYFNLTGVDPDNDPNYNNGSITINIDVDGGYVDLEARLRQDGGAWSPWSAVTDGQTVSNRTAGFYEVQMRSAGTTLLIEPIESVTLTQPVV
jgi:hypothetical protein